MAARFPGTLAPFLKNPKTHIGVSLQLMLVNRHNCLTYRLFKFIFIIFFIWSLISVSILWSDIRNALLLWGLLRLASSQLWQTFLTDLMLCCFNITFHRLLKLSRLHPCWCTVCFLDLLTKFRWGARGWTTQDSGVTGVCLESFPRKVRLAKVSLEIFPQTLPSLPLVYHEHL